MRIIKYLPGIIALVFALMLPVQSLAKGYHNSGDVEVDIVSDRRGTLQRFDASSARGGRSEAMSLPEMANAIVFV